MARRRRQFEPEQVQVVDIDHQGRGVATASDGKTVFVHGVLPGETATIQRMRRHRRFDEAKLLSLEEASPHRVTPKCQAFDVCGGCALQHLSADIQIQQKQQHLLENLERIGGVKPNHVLKPITGPLWAYRRRARLTVRFVDKKERVLVGFRERLSHYIADIERCEVLSGNVGDLVRPLADLIGGLSIKRHVPQVEVAVADNATILVFRILESLTDGDKQKILEFAAETGVCAYIQTGGLDTIAPLAAPATLHYSLPQQSLTFDFGPSDFVQINGEINQQIVTKAIELLELQGDEKLLDLFCGLGNFSLSLARHCAQVVGVEGSESLVQKARANAQANGIHNAEFFVADLFKDVSDFAWAKGQYDVLFLDPPRAGAKEIMTLLESMNPSKVLYVSCHPGSLARDAETLVQAGFTLVHAGVADMFPHTAHVESIGLFLRPE